MLRLAGRLGAKTLQITGSSPCPSSITFARDGTYGDRLARKLAYSPKPRRSSCKRLRAGRIGAISLPVFASLSELSREEVVRRTALEWFRYQALSQELCLLLRWAWRRRRPATGSAAVPQSAAGVSAAVLPPRKRDDGLNYE